MRAKSGLPLGFQYPQEIAGVSVNQFPRLALSARKGNDLSALELRLVTMHSVKASTLTHSSSAASSSSVS